MQAKTLALSAGAALIASLSFASAAQAAPGFAAQDLSSGYMMVGEGSCGAGHEGSCGADKTKTEGKCGEGKCGEGKATEGSCGADKAHEGSCGADKAHEGSCGADKAHEGSCGADKK